MAMGRGWRQAGRVYARYATRVIATRASAKRFLIGVGVATLVACSMFYFKAVTVKLLPFDNKSEVQLVAICRRALRWSRPAV
jgi:multidrug efflux pump subunit AcrB